MKAFVIVEPGKAELQDVPKPEAGPGEVLIKVRASGFCGTDIHTFKGEHPSKYPLIPGHEFSGVVAEVGAGVTRFTVGAPVTADPNIFCESCYYCKQNKQIHCENIQVIGNTRSGAFAEYVTVPERCVFSAAGLNLDQAAMAEPLGCVINAHNKIVIPLGGSVVIFGAGTIGLMHLLMAKRRGAAQVVVVDLKAEQLHMAETLGADQTYLSGIGTVAELREAFPRGFDVVIDATGAPKVVEMAIPLTAKTGTFMAFGACPINSKATINPFDLYYNDWKLIGSYALEKTLGQSIALLRSGLNLEPLVGQRITLDDMPEWFDRFQKGATNNKIIVTFDS
ncbi:MAG: zinc-dependent alcohol dehydrogenase family protein [Planctomycetaceae bacterium]|nr:zinc-dependent alcohol dehydrogenase family protein [Planctomycetaceae bacterium]